MLTEMKQQTEKGFTLIELMIVVAIIGILAAIAIPQFSSYRIKAFNSAAQSDIQTLKLSEEAFYADNQNYGGTTAAGTGGVLGAGTVIFGGTPGELGDAVATHPVITVAPSTKVGVVATTDNTGASMVIEAGHEQGNRTYAMDSDDTALYWATKVAGTAFASGGLTSTINVNDVNTKNNAAGNAYAPL